MMVKGRNYNGFRPLRIHTEYEQENNAEISPYQ